LFSTLFLLALLTSCKKDDDAPAAIPERDRTEQQAMDFDSLQNYLKTHYYNHALFQEPGDHKISDLIIKELPQNEKGDFLDMPDPDQNKLLSDAVNIDAPLTTRFQDVEYQYYILKLNEGGGEKPQFSDKIRLNYKGFLADGTTFDSSTTAV